MAEYESNWRLTGPHAKLRKVGGNWSFGFDGDRQCVDALFAAYLFCAVVRVARGTLQCNCSCFSFAVRMGAL